MAPPANQASLVSLRAITRQDSREAPEKGVNASTGSTLRTSHLLCTAQRIPRFRMRRATPRPRGAPADNSMNSGSSRAVWSTSSLEIGRPSGKPPMIVPGQNAIYPLLSELEALDLPGRGLRQVRDELDPARVLVGRDLVL